jgi:serine protease AprX
VERTALASLLLLASFSASRLAAAPNGDDAVSDDVKARVRGAQSADLIPVIVQTYQDPSDDHLRRVQGKGGKLKSRHHAIHGYSVQVPAGEVASLAEDPEVERVSYDAPVEALLDVALKAARGDVAADMAGIDGRGIGIALIDTGVQSHLDLLDGRGPAEVLEIEIVGHEKGLADYYGHGTHVAGILSGSGAASSGPLAFRTFRGVAPGARLISVRALQPDGTGTTSDVLAGIDWVLSHRKSYNIRVLNLSLGHPIGESYLTDPLCRAARQAVAAGIVVVAAAGNGGRTGSGFGTILSPANEPSLITVGAMDDSGTVAREDDVLAPYSAKGPTLIDSIAKPDLVAPGSSIVSLRAVGSVIDVNRKELVLHVGDYSTAQPGDAAGAYLSLSGTSLAAPMVAGAAALMLQKDPALRPSDVKARLMIASSKDQYLPLETGAGYLDIAAALNSAARTDSALSPLVVEDATGALSFQPLENAWGDEWGQGLVWGGGRWLGTILATENDRVTASGLVWSGGNRMVGLNCALEALGLVWSGGNRMVDSLGLVWSGGNRTVDSLGLVWSGGNRTVDSLGLVWSGGNLVDDATVETLGLVWSGGNN